MKMEENYDDLLNQLQELGGSDFEIVDNEPDVRGWSVYGSNNVRVGLVTELLFTPQEGKIRYLVVDLESNDMGIEEDRCVLIPIGIAELYPEDDDVLVPTITSDQLAALPAYSPGQISPAVEHEIRTVFSVPGIGIADRSGFYAHEHFDEEKFYRSRGSFSGQVTQGTRITPGSTPLKEDEDNPYAGNVTPTQEENSGGNDRTAAERSTGTSHDHEIWQGAKSDSPDLGYGEDDDDDDPQRDGKNRGVSFP